MSMIIVGASGSSSAGGASPTASTIGPLVASSTGSTTTIIYQVLIRQLTADQISSGQTPGANCQFSSTQATNHVVGLSGMVYTGSNISASVLVLNNFSNTFLSPAIPMQAYTETTFSFPVTGVSFSAGDVLTFKCTFSDYTRDASATYSYLFPLVTLGA